MDGINNFVALFIYDIIVYTSAIGKQWVIWNKTRLGDTHASTYMPHKF